MIKLLCIVEIPGHHVERARRALDTFRARCADNDITGVTIYQATPQDLAAGDYHLLREPDGAREAEARPAYGAGRCRICGEAWPCTAHPHGTPGTLERCGDVLDYGANTTRCQYPKGHEGAHGDAARRWN